MLKSLAILLFAVLAQTLVCNAKNDESAQAVQEKLQSKSLDLSKVTNLSDLTDQFWSTTSVPFVLPFENESGNATVSNMKQVLQKNVVPIPDLIPLLRVTLKSPVGTVYKGGISFKPSSKPNSQEEQDYKKILQEKEYSFKVLTSLTQEDISSMYEKGFLETANLNDAQFDNLKKFLGETEVIDNYLPQKVSAMSNEDFKKVNLKFYFSSTDSFEVRDLASSGEGISSGLVGIFDFGRGIVRSAPYEEANSNLVAYESSTTPRLTYLRFEPTEEEGKLFNVSQSVVLTGKEFATWLTKQTQKKLIFDKNLGSAEQFGERKIVVGKGLYTQDQLSTLALFALGVKSKVVSDIMLISDDPQVSISEEMLSPHRQNIEKSRKILDRLKYSSAIPFSQSFFETRNQSEFGGLTPPQKFFVKERLKNSGVEFDPKSIKDNSVVEFAQSGWFQGFLVNEYGVTNFNYRMW